MRAVAGFALPGGAGLICLACQRRKPREWKEIVRPENAAGLACNFCGEPMLKATAPK